MIPDPPNAPSTPNAPKKGRNMYAARFSEIRAGASTMKGACGRFSRNHVFARGYVPNPLPNPMRPPAPPEGNVHETVCQTYGFLERGRVVLGEPPAGNARQQGTALRRDYPVAFLFGHGIGKAPGASDRDWQSQALRENPPDGHKVKSCRALE